jgi:hypothetical protein
MPLDSSHSPPLRQLSIQARLVSHDKRFYSAIHQVPTSPTQFISLALIFISFRSLALTFCAQTPSSAYLAVYAPPTQQLNNHPLIFCATPFLALQEAPQPYIHEALMQKLNILIIFSLFSRAIH